ncbi:hypothetical protein YSY43_39590 [Paenibacillus sp. YSY-4.3]
MKLWGVDPELGQRLVHGLADQFQVLFFDYEGHLFSHPNPEGLTAEQVVPKLVFAGEQDTIVYGEKFGSVKVDIIGLLEKNKQHLINMGWDVEILKGRDVDHTKAMQPAAVLPLIKPWFIAKLLGDNNGY